MGSSGNSPPSPWSKIFRLVQPLPLRLRYRDGIFYRVNTQEKRQRWEGEDMGLNHNMHARNHPLFTSPKIRQHDEPTNDLLVGYIRVNHQSKKRPKSIEGELWYSEVRYILSKHDQSFGRGLCLAVDVLRLIRYERNIIIVLNYGQTN